jgi:hypothetical protein
VIPSRPDRRAVAAAAGGVPGIARKTLQTFAVRLKISLNMTS